MSFFAKDLSDGIDNRCRSNRKGRNISSDLKENFQLINLSIPYLNYLLVICSHAYSIVLSCLDNSSQSCNLFVMILFRDCAMF